MIANKKAITPILSFLKTINVEEREVAKKIELKWENKNDQVSEYMFD